MTALLRRVPAILIAGMMLASAAPAGAATPASGSVSAATPSAAWTGESEGFGPNLVAIFGVDACVAPACDAYSLTVAEAGTLKVTTAADDGTTLIDTYVVKPDGTVVSARGDETTPAVVTIANAAAGAYQVHSYVNAVAGPLPYSGTATLNEPGSGGGGGGGTGGGGSIVVPGSAPSAGDVVICIIDTGLNATHREFAPDQVVAWWDFTTPDVPAAGDFYYSKALPHDGFGHGTQVAGMAAGLNADPSKTKSFAPGTHLAIARVGDDAGSVVGNVANAFRWCTDTAKADVINMSIGSIVPIPGAPLLFTAEYDAIAYAREHGALVTLSNGNGVGRLGYIPSSGANSTYSSSMDTLNVGPWDLLDGPNNTDAEVAAQYAVHGPVNTNDTDYADTAGTSFSSPLVAGFAAKLVREAQAAGTPLAPAQLETLIKYSARDTALPPSWEGYGVIDGAQLAGAIAHARAGTLPGRPSPDVNGFYVEEVSNRMREINNGIFRFTVTPPAKRSPSARRRAEIRKLVARRVARADARRSRTRPTSAPASAALRLLK